MRHELDRSVIAFQNMSIQFLEGFGLYEKIHLLEMDDSNFEYDNYLTEEVKICNQFNNITDEEIKFKGRTK
jgi:hypothetical protein